MTPAASPHTSSAGEPTRLRHRSVPEREFGDRLIVARPVDGAPVVLAAPAAFVWRQLDEWVSLHDLDRRVAASYPGLPTQERWAACEQILEKLGDDDLVERG